MEQDQNNKQPRDKEGKNDKEEQGRLVDGDPPVIVGGGGSSYVWLKRNQGRRQVDPRSDDEQTGVKPGAPKPRTRSDYEWCSRINTNPSYVYFHDGRTLDAQGNPAEVPLQILDNTDWYVRIE